MNEDKVDFSWSIGIPRFMKVHFMALHFHKTLAELAPVFAKQKKSEKYTK